MKTQQRSFVVEIKSTRRRLEIQPKSIWGNTDFAALIRDDEATLPFMHNANSEGPVTVEGLPADLEKQIEGANVADVGGEATRVMPLPDFDQIGRYRQDAVFTENHVLNVASVVLPSETGKALKHRRKRRGSVAECVIAMSSVETAIDMVDTDTQDLAALSAENLCLKQRLAEHFQQESAQLREMLERFEIASCAS